MLLDILNCLFATFGAIFNAFLKLLPLYNQLNNLKEQFIATALGVPTILVSIVLAIPFIYKTTRWVINFIF